MFDPLAKLPIRIGGGGARKSTVIALVYFCKGSKASANALPICAKIFALPK